MNNSRLKFCAVILITTLAILIPPQAQAVGESGLDDCVFEECWGGQTAPADPVAYCAENPFTPYCRSKNWCEKNPESPFCQPFLKGKARDYKMSTDILTNLESVATSWTTANVENDYPNSPFLILAGILQLIVAFVGLIFVIQTIRAGFLWLTARGNEEQVKKAQGLLKASVTGIVIMLLAYTITALVVDIVLQAGTSLPLNASQ